MIIDAALDVFARKGFKSASLTEVAERAGVTAQGILYHFRSKDELLLAVIAERDRRHGEVVAELASDHPWRLISEAVRFAELAEEDPNLLALHTALEIESMDPASPAHGYFSRRNTVLRRGLEDSLRQAKRSGYVRSEVDCEAVAAEILAFEHGAAILWLKNDDVSLVELYRGYFDRLVRHLSP